MLKKPIYLDYAAGTPILPDVLRGGLQIAEELYGNPSALHAPARASADFLAESKQELAKVLAVKPESLIFTAGATEANNLIALSLRKTYPGAKLAGLKIDHDSWRRNADYCLEVSGRNAQVEAAEILKIPEDVCCLSLAGINNELGVIQPFSLIKSALGEVRRNRRNIGNELPLLLHIDASQMALVHNLQPQALADADLLTLNGAKFYAFKQSGLLYVKQNLKLKPPFKGGGQEQAWRPGGESLLLANGLRMALVAVNKQKPTQIKRLSTLQNWFENKLETMGAEVILKHSSSRSPLMTGAIFAGYDNETLALKLSNEGIYVGITSACHSRSDLLETSALKALNYGEKEIYAALRFSFAYETTESQLEVVLQTLSEILNR